MFASAAFFACKYDVHLSRRMCSVRMTTGPDFMFVLVFCLGCLCFLDGFLSMTHCCVQSSPNHYMTCNYDSCCDCRHSLMTWSSSCEPIPTLRDNWGPRRASVTCHILLLQVLGCQWWHLIYIGRVLGTPECCCHCISHCIKLCPSNSVIQALSFSHMTIFRKATATSGSAVPQ